MSYCLTELPLTESLLAELLLAEAPPVIIFVPAMYARVTQIVELLDREAFGSGYKVELLHRTSLWQAARRRVGLEHDKIAVTKTCKAH